MARASRKAKTSSVKVNFKGIESRKTPPEGDYLVEVLEANSGKSSQGNDQIEFVLEVAAGEFKGAKLWFYCPLAESSLWKLHAFLTALGEDVPEDEMDIDLSDLIGKQCVGVLTHETYNGKKRAKMTDFDTAENFEDPDDKKSSKKGKKDDDDEDEDKSSKKGAKDKGKKKGPEPVAKSAVEEMDREELEELIESHGLDVDADSKKLKKDEALLAAVLEALEEEELLEEEKKSSKKDDKKSSKKAKTYDEDEVEDMDEDELQEVIDESKIDVDLDDYKKLPKKVAAVIDALKKAKLLA